MNINEAEDFLSQLPLPTAHFNPFGEVVYVNSAFTKLLGYTKEDIPTVEAHWPIFFPDVTYREKVQKDWVTMLETSAKSGVPIQPMLLDIVAKSSEVKKLEVHSLQMGTLAITMWIDFTEKMEAEEELRKSKQEAEDALKAAEQASRAKSAFLANMSHELRTPLNAMLGYAQVLTRHETLTPIQRQGVDTILRSGDHLLTLINDVLDLAKIEAGRFELIPGPCSLPALLHGLEELFHVRTSEKGVSFRYAPSTDLPRRVELDERRLRQVLMNLLSNAVKFTETGEVTLGCRVLAESGEDPDRLRFDISDTGIGIPADRLPTLFQPFQQEGEAAYKSQGTGLGLAISRNLVEQMGGELWAESEAGRGSRFSVVIPLHRLDADQIYTAPREQSRAQFEGYSRTDGNDSPFTILVVDDVADNRSVLTSLLTPQGFEVREAKDGETAIHMATENPPDLVLMDLVMPGINGLQATQQLLAQEKLSKLPVVACTASTFQEDRDKCLTAGCREHIGKPVQAEKLFEILEKVLPLEWIESSREEPAADSTSDDSSELSEEQRTELLEMARLGKIGQIREILLAIPPRGNALLENLLTAAERFDLKLIRILLRRG